MRTILRTLWIAICVVMGLNPPAHAHPHAWIDVQSQVVFNADGKITSIQVNWLLDEGYTIFVINGLSEDIADPLTPAGFNEMAQKVMQNLRPYSFFTQITHNNQAIAIADVANVKASLTKDHRFSLIFSALLEHPVPPEHFSYRIFDPTYYIEVLHIEGKDAITLKNAPKTCTVKLIKPTPDIEDVVRAANLGQTDQADDNLGEVFAERVRLSCP